MSYFRFRRSIPIIPGLRLNIGKKGVSVSAGVRGAHVTLGRHGTRTTVGIPGTGMSATHYERHQATVNDATASPFYNPWIPVVTCAVITGVAFAVRHGDSTYQIFCVITLIAIIVCAVWLVLILQVNSGNCELLADRQRKIDRLDYLNRVIQGFEAADKVSAFYFENAEVKGPVILSEIMRRIASGILPNDVQICRTGSEIWEQIPGEAMRAYREFAG